MKDCHDIISFIMQKTRVLPHHATVLCICLVSLLCSSFPPKSKPAHTLSIYETAFNFISMEEDQQDYFILPTPSNSVSKLISLQADLFYNTLVSVFSPFHSLFSMVSEETNDNVESTSTVQSVPSHITSVSILLLKKIGLFFLSAAYVFMILISLLILAAVVGVNLVHLWVEEPVFVKESIHFDYTEAHPTAVFLFNGGGVSGVYGFTKQNQISVPVGHTFCVSLVLVMPESDFNRELGMFQLSAELLSVHGNVIARSSQPCMLRFRSSPIRLARTVMMGVPLVLGISGETQKINVPILSHKEHNRRTNAIIVTLHPRAGTTSLPQIYEAEIVINSHLPWAKELVRKWKWTFYVWMSLYVYIMLLMFLLCCYRPLIFLMTPEYSSDHRVREEPINNALQIRELGDVSEPSELLRRWRRIRNRRKNILSRIGVPETFGSSVPSISLITREDVTSMTMEYDVEDSESVCGLEG